MWTASPGRVDLSARTALLSDEAIRTLDLEDYVNERYRDTLAQVPALPGEPGGGPGAGGR